MATHTGNTPRVAPHVIRVAVIDATPLLRMALGTVIDGDDGLRLVADGPDIDAITHAAQARGADVIVIDPWSGGGGVDTLRAAREIFPDARVIVISHGLTPERIVACMDELAHGCVEKTIAPADLPSIIRQVVAGLQVKPEVPRTTGHPLTPRELEVLRAAAAGKPNAHIAQELFVTPQTVKFHLSNVYRKLGARNRTEAAHTALTRGLID